MTVGEGADLTGTAGQGKSPRPAEQPGQRRFLRALLPEEKGLLAEGPWDSKGHRTREAGEPVVSWIEGASEV